MQKLELLSSTWSTMSEALHKAIMSNDNGALSCPDHALSKPMLQSITRARLFTAGARSKGLRA